jgi:hypothetical protein
MINNLVRRINNLVRKLGKAAHAFILVLGIALFLLQFLIQDESVKNLILNLGSEFIGVFLIFYFVKQTFGFDTEEQRQLQQEYFLTELRNTLERQAARELTIYPSRMSMYDSLIGTLKSDHWKKVRIFAPVGFWRKDELKQKWLEALVESARTEKVETIWAVFGLPPLQKDGKLLQKSQVMKNLEYVEQRLIQFSGLRNVSLHFYPPSYASVGLGAVIFERKDGTCKFAFALASHEHEDVVDAGFGINNEQVFSFAQDWFDDRIFWKATSAFVLQDDSSSLTERWDCILKEWYGEDYLSNRGAD